MARGFQGAVLKVLGAGEHLLTVLAVEDVTPHYRRVRCEALTLFDRPFGPGDYLRLWIPDPKGTGKEFQRGYTVVAPDPDTLTLSLEIALHPETGGPASVWAAAVSPGDTIAVSRYGSPKFAVGDPVPDGFLLIGDTSAIPAIRGVIEVLPRDVPVEVILETAHDTDAGIPLAEHPRLTVTRLPRTGDARLLAEAIGDRDWSNWYAWATAESAATRRVRERLKEHGFPRGDVHAQAYWMQGRAMGRDRGGEAGTHHAAAPASVPAPAETPEGRPAKPAAWRSRAGAALLAPLKGRLILAGAVQALVSLLQLSPFAVLAELARRVLAGTADRASLAGLGILALVLFGAGTAVAFALVAAMHVLDARFGHEVRTAIVAKLRRLPLGWFGDRTSGRVKQAVQGDTASLHYLVTHAVLDVVAAIVTPVAVLVYLFAVDWRIAVLLLVPLLVFGILTTRMVQHSAAAIPASVEWRGRVAAEAVAYFDGLPVVRAFDTGPNGAFRRTLAAHAAFLESWQRPFVGRKAVIELVTRPSTSLLLILGAGTFLVLDGMPPADLVPFLLLGVTFSGQMLAVGYGLSSVREAVLAARRIGLVLLEPELAAPGVPATLPPSPHGTGRTVRFVNVSFGYRPGHRAVDGVDLELRPGTVTALVGPSGAGKSTLAALLARFHDVTEGAITIDGVDIGALDTRELYREVGFVFQHASVIAGTIADNIALARPGATRARIEEAARAAQLHERITRLPHGYDTLLGGDGALSGGEAQRLQIARALLADPRILVLDEATAFADPESEYHVQKALTRLVAGRTVLVIAHRLHTVADADAIAVLDNGRVRQYGRHEALLAEPGPYRDLWNAAVPAAEAAVKGAA